MPGLVLGRTPLTALDVLVVRVNFAVGRHGSCPWSGNAAVGFLTPWDAWSGLDGPMPHRITPVLWGRCSRWVGRGRPGCSRRRWWPHRGRPVSVRTAQVALVEGVEAAGVGEEDRGRLGVPAVFGQVQVRFEGLTAVGGVHLGRIGVGIGVGELAEDLAGDLAEGDLRARLLRGAELDAAHGQRGHHGQCHDRGEEAAPAQRPAAPGRDSQESAGQGEDGYVEGVLAAEDRTDRSGFRDGRKVGAQQQGADRASGRYTTRLAPGSGRRVPRRSQRAA